MPEKYFSFTPAPKFQSKEIIEKIQGHKHSILQGEVNKVYEKNKTALSVEEDNLIHTEGRVIVKVDCNFKDNHTFSNGLTIAMPRDYNNLNRRYTAPVQGFVVSSEKIPKGSLVLIGHNTVHDVNRIFNYKDELGSDVHYYSIPENQVFLYKENGGEWKCLPPFETALQIYEPYKGLLAGIDPKLLKDTLFVTSGELAGKVVKTVKASNYIVIFRDPTIGQEQQVLRFRPFGDEKEQREPEAIAILNDFTEKVLNGEYLIGLELRDAKPYHLHEVFEKVFSKKILNENSLI